MVGGLIHILHEHAPLVHRHVEPVLGLLALAQEGPARIFQCGADHVLRDTGDRGVALADSTANRQDSLREDASLDDPLALSKTSAIATSHWASTSRENSNSHAKRHLLANTVWEAPAFSRSVWCPGRCRTRP